MPFALFVLVADGALVGWICWGPTPCTIGTFDLYWIVVDPAWQGRGVGSALVAEMEGQLRGKARLIGRANKVIRAPLVHEWIGPERGWHFCAARLAHQFHVIDVRRAVRPLVSPRERRGHWRRRSAQFAGHCVHR